MSILAWFLGTKVGRTLSAAALILAALSVALLKAFSAGRAKERLKQTQASLDNLRNRAKTDEDVSKMGDAGVRRELGGWVSDDKRDGV